MRSRVPLTLIVLALVSWLLIDAGAVWARAGGGGSRGSRSYSAPARPPPVAPANPATPSRGIAQPTPQPAPQRPGFFGSLMGGIAGFALGGLLGSLLFGGGFGGGIGLLEILLVVVGVFLLMRMIRGRQSAPEPAYAGAGASAYGASDPGGSGGGAVAVAIPPEAADRDRGIEHIQQMDRGFEPDAFAGWARTAFTDVQAAISRRDMSTLADRLTPQEYARLQAQCDRLRGARQTNRVEQIRIDRAEVTEAWQESGQDWVTVYFAVSLVDYTVDDASGGIVDGSRTRQDIEEYWTFTRPVGANPWRLSAIQTA